MKRDWRLVPIAIVIIIFLGFFLIKYGKKEVRVSNFEECVAAGYPVAESYPRQCRTYDNQIFIEDIGEDVNESENIIVEIPQPNVTIESPIQVRGKARGSWFFEGSFDAELYDSDENLIASGIAKADGEWMTEDFVPFRVELDYGIRSTETGTIILRKANPSGLPEHEESISIPVKFKYYIYF